MIENGHKTVIKEIWMYVQDTPVGERCIFLQTERGNIPMLFFEEARAKENEALVQRQAIQTKMMCRLVKFTVREDIKNLLPIEVKGR